MLIALVHLSLTGCLGDKEKATFETGRSETKDSIETATDTGLDPNEVNSGGLQYGFFAIHLDPGTNPGDNGVPSADRPIEYLGALTRLVEKADQYDHKLTLMFTPQWAYHVASENCLLPIHDSLPPGSYSYRNELLDSCLSLFRAFEAWGHEIAIHHHPKDAPNSWDGYSDNTDHMTDEDYLGTTNDLLDIVAEIPTGGISSIRSGTLEEYPTNAYNLKFMSARGPTAYVNPEERGDLASTPCVWSGDGPFVWRLRMRALELDSILELQSAHVQLSDSEVTYTAGFVTHAKDTDGLSSALSDALFAEISARGITFEGLSTVASHYPYTDLDAAPGTEYDCPPDESLE